MPAWLSEPTEPIQLYDCALRVCQAFHWSERYVVHEMPIHRFWAALDYLNRRSKRLAAAAKENPYAATAYYLSL